MPRFFFSIIPSATIEFYPLVLILQKMVEPIPFGKWICSTKTCYYNLLYVFFFEKNAPSMRSLFLWPISSVTCSRLGNSMWAWGNWSRRLYELPGELTHSTSQKLKICIHINQDEGAYINNQIESLSWFNSLNHHKHDFLPILLMAEIRLTSW